MGLHWRRDRPVGELHTELVRYRSTVELTDPHVRPALRACLYLFCATEDPVEVRFSHDEAWGVDSILTSKADLGCASGEALQAAWALMEHLAENVSADPSPRTTFLRALVQRIRQARRMPLQVRPRRVKTTEDLRKYVEYADTLYGFPVEGNQNPDYVGAASRCAKMCELAVCLSKLRCNAFEDFVSEFPGKEWVMFALKRFCSAI